MGNQQPNRSAAHHHYRTTEQRRHPPHDVDGDGDGLRQGRDLVGDVVGYRVQPVLCHRHPARQGTMAVDADEAQPGARIRRSDVAGGADTAGDERIDQHAAARKAPRFRHAHELMAKRQREAGSRMTALHDVQVRPPQPGEARPDDDLAGGWDGLPDLPPGEAHRPR